MSTHTSAGSEGGEGSQAGDGDKKRRRGCGTIIHLNHIESEKDYK